MSTPNMDLTTVPSNSLQPSVPVNDSLQALDALIRPGGIIQSFESAPPTTTDDDAGLTWVVDVGASGAFSGHDDEIALCTAANLWRFFAPREGWLVHNLSDELNYAFGGSAGWTQESGGGGLPPDGNYTDITVSGGGTAWEIAAGAVGSSELASTAVTPGSYTSADITVDQDGRITAAANGSGGGSYTGTTNRITVVGSVIDIAATYVGQTSLTTLGTVATGTWNATAIGTTFGGTGQTSYATGDLLYGSATNVLSKLSAGTNGHVLTLAAGVPTWAASGGGGGLTNWTESVSTSAPNVGTPVVVFTATNPASNVDVAIVGKGSTAFSRQIPDNTTTGGNKRGTGAFDGQVQRSVNSQVASGYSAACFGQSNTASGSRAFAAGDNNTASGNAAIAMGDTNTSSEANTIALGRSNNVSVQDSVALGNENTVSASFAAAIGAQNTVNAQSSKVFGEFCTTGSSAAQFAHVRGYFASANGIYGADVFASGRFNVAGDAQKGNYVLRSDTTNATPEAMTTSNAAAGFANQITLSNNTAFSVVGTVTARESGGNARSWKVEAFIVRGANAASTTLVAGASPSIIGTSGAFTGTLALSADTTNGCLSVVVTGVAATNIKWVAALDTSEVVG